MKAETCGQLHKQEEGCLQEVPAAGGWKFCPLCGRPTGHIHVQKMDGQLNVPMQQAQSRFVMIRNEGLTPVSVTLELEKPLSGVQLAEKQMRSLIVIPRMPQRVELTLPALASTAHTLGTLLIQAQDAALDSETDPWQARLPRALRLPLTAEVDTPADLRVVEQIALFREGVSARMITIINGGKARADILEVKAPFGYEAALTAGVSRLGGGERVTCKVTRKWGQTAEDPAHLQILASGDKTLSVELHSAASQEIRSLASAIIGIDFGTTFSSIAFRECRDIPELPDDVEFLKPGGEPSERFPTLIWISKQGDLEFGSEAENRYIADPIEGYLIREIKTALRDPQAAEIHPKRFKDEGLRLVQRLYGENWGEALITEYLRWLYQVRILPELNARFGTTDVDARYIFSLPVLDYNIDAQTQYERQRTAMTKCITRAGFPVHASSAENRVEFEFEPVCGAIGLLHPPADVLKDIKGDAGKDSWPVLGTRGYPVSEGTTLAVFDSGGGTTDVVQARVVEKPDSNGTRLALTIERCLGVGSQAEAFGGEWVTKGVENALSNAGSLRDADGSEIKDGTGSPAADWYSGQVDPDLFRDDNDEFRESAKDVKFQLALDQPYTASHNGEVTTIKTILLTRLMVNKLQSLAAELEQRVFDAGERANTNYYLFIGGNTRISFVRKWAQTLMQDKSPEYNKRRLLLPDKYLQLAVAYGAAWVPDARVRNAVPYGLTVFAGTELLLNLPRNQSQDIMPRNRKYPLPPGVALPIRLQALIGDKEYCVGEASIPNTGDRTARVEAWTSLQDGVLRITYCFLNPANPAEKGDMQSLLEYTL